MPMIIFVIAVLYFNQSSVKYFTCPKIKHANFKFVEPCIQSTLFENTLFYILILIGSQKCDSN